MSQSKRTASPSQMMEHYYKSDLAQTKQEVTAAPSNLYGFEVQNNSATAEVFVQIFNLESAAVTVGVTVPDMTFRIPAAANYGKDPQSFPIKFLPIGMTIACTATRLGAGAPNAACTINLWYWDKGN